MECERRHVCWCGQDEYFQKSGEECGAWEVCAWWCWRQGVLDVRYVHLFLMLRLRLRLRLSLRLRFRRRLSVRVQFRLKVRVMAGDKS